MSINRRRIHRVVGTLLAMLLTVGTLSAQNNRMTDGIVAIVNNRIILKSDVDQAVAETIRTMREENPSVSFSQEMWYETLESLIDNNAMLERARVDSIFVEDAMVDRRMDMQIQTLVSQIGSESRLEEYFGQSIVQIRAEYREQLREQLIIQQLMQLKSEEITITRPEVRAFFNSIPEDQLPMLPEQVSLSHIVKIPPPLADAADTARREIEAIRDSIVVQGYSFEEMARRHTDDPSGRAPSGHIGLLPMGQLVPEYSAAAAALDTGEVSGVVETEFGYHLIRLNRRVGDNIDTHNLLIRIDNTLRDDQVAIDQLEAIRDSALVEGVPFEDLARRNSDDEATRIRGGRLLNPYNGLRPIPVDSLDQALYRIAIQLDEPGEISEPALFNPQTQGNAEGTNVEQAYRIVRLDNRIEAHIVNFEQDFEWIRSFALQQKRSDEIMAWLEELRDDVYIEYKIDVPERYRSPNPEIDEFQSTLENP